MPRENLDDYELPYVDFYVKIPNAKDRTTDILDADEFLETTIHDHHQELKTPTTLSQNDVDKIRQDSLDSAGPAPKRIETDNNDDSLFSAQ